jgi:hypothetical protein
VDEGDFHESTHEAWKAWKDEERKRTGMNWSEGSKEDEKFLLFCAFMVYFLNWSVIL